MLEFLAFECINCSGGSSLCVQIDHFVSEAVLKVKRGAFRTDSQLTLTLGNLHLIARSYSNNFIWFAVFDSFIWLETALTLDREFLLLLNQFHESRSFRTERRCWWLLLHVQAETWFQLRELAMTVWCLQVDCVWVFEVWNAQWFGTLWLYVLCSSFSGVACTCSLKLPLSVLIVCKAALCMGSRSSSAREAAILTVSTLLFAQDAKRALRITIRGTAAAIDATTVLSLDFSFFSGNLAYRLFVLQSDFHHHFFHINCICLGHWVSFRVSWWVATSPIDSWRGTYWRLSDREQFLSRILFWAEGWHGNHLLVIPRAFTTSIAFVYSVLTGPSFLKTTKHWRIVVQLGMRQGPPVRLQLAELFLRILLAELLLRKLLGLLVLQASIEYEAALFWAIFEGMTSAVLRWLAGCETASLIDFEKVLGLSFHIIFDLELVQIKHHVFEHINSRVLGVANKILWRLLMVSHIVNDVRIASRLGRCNMLRL